MGFKISAANGIIVTLMSLKFVTVSILNFLVSLKFRLLLNVLNEKNLKLYKQCLIKMPNQIKAKQVKTN